MKLTILGSGTSHGIPVIGCSCRTCTSTDPKDRRFRASLLITDEDTSTKNGTGTPTTVVIDTGPEFRLQMLSQKVSHLDAVLLTHSHADHMNGLDDVRIFSCTGRESVPESKEKPALPIYGSYSTLKALKVRFDYIFGDTQKAGGKPKIELHEVRTATAGQAPGTQPAHSAAPAGDTQPADSAAPAHSAAPAADSGATASSEATTVTIGKLTFTPVLLYHGKQKDTGWLIRDSDGHSAAYLTDCSSIPEETFAAVHGVDVLIIDGLRQKHHPTHFSFDEAAAAAARIQPGAVYMTHICHDFTHIEIQALLQELQSWYDALADIPVLPAYDGLSITINGKVTGTAKNL